MERIDRFLVRLLGEDKDLWPLMIAGCNCIIAITAWEGYVLISLFAGHEINEMISCALFSFFTLNFGFCMGQTQAP